MTIPRKNKTRSFIAPIKPILTALFVCLAQIQFAFTIFGTVTDESGEPVPFVTIYIKGTTSGTTSNAAGAFSLEAPAGKHTLIFQSIGFKMLSREVNLAHDLRMDVVLQQNAIELKEVQVGNNKEDPAYEIIRKAQKKRSYYLKQVDRYSCDVYIKGLQRITKYPKKVLGKEINLNNIIDTATGIAYLSESVSKFYFEQPDKIKETLISSRVSGRNNAFSYNQASDMLINIYQNLVQTGIAQRGIISPIASGAMMSYKYKFQGSFFENGVWVNKIQVSPKRPADPCFTGTLYICDSTWRVYSADLYVTKENQLRFVDTLRIMQVYLPVSDSVWMLFNNKFSFTFSFLGFEGNGYYTGINSNYELNFEKGKKFFNGEEWHVNEDSNKKDSVYWDSIRPMPLTVEEINDYRRKDSLHKIWDSKEYKDSLDARQNRPGLSMLWQGYRFRNSWQEYSLTIPPLATSIQYNSVQGWNPTLSITFDKWNKETKKEMNWSLNSCYGVSSLRWFVWTEGSIEYQPLKLARIYFSGGRELSQFNGSNPISPFVNTLYTLIDRLNYAKYYQKDFARIGWRYEFMNGFLLSANTEFAERSPLQNASDFSWSRSERMLLSNNPLNPLFDSLSFSRNKKAEVGINLRIRIRQRYMTRPGEKITMGSRFPEINLNWKRAVAGIAGAQTDYETISLAISDRLNLKRLGRSVYLVRAGTFLSARNISFMDFKHFNGNQTWFSDFDLQKFQLLEYYEHSTKAYYAEGWYSHNFGGFILNKFPLLKRLKLEEIAGARFLHTADLKLYSEFSFGFRYLVSRFDFIYGIKNGVSRTGLRFGLLF